MKTIIVSFFLAMTLFASGQEPLTYSEVVEVPDSAYKEELYRRAKYWFTTTFRDANAVLQTEDAINGELTGRGQMKHTMPMIYGSGSGKITFIVSVFVKDGRYKYSITQFYHDLPKQSFGLITTSDQYKTSGAGKNMYNNMYLDIKQKIKLEIPPIVQKLKNQMLVPSGNSDKGDW